MHWMVAGQRRRNGDSGLSGDCCPNIWQRAEKAATGWEFYGSIYRLKRECRTTRSGTTNGWCRRLHRSCGRSKNLRYCSCRSAPCRDSSELPAALRISGPVRSSCPGLPAGRFFLSRKPSVRTRCCSPLSGGSPSWISGSNKNHSIYRFPEHETLVGKLRSRTVFSRSFHRIRPRGLPRTVSQPFIRHGRSLDRMRIRSLPGTPIHPPMTSRHFLTARSRRTWRPIGRPSHGRAILPDVKPSSRHVYVVCRVFQRLTLMGSASTAQTRGLSMEPHTEPWILHWVEPKQPASLNRAKSRD